MREFDPKSEETLYSMSNVTFTYIDTFKKDSDAKTPQELLDYAKDVVFNPNPDYPEFKDKAEEIRAQAVRLIAGMNQKEFDRFCHFPSFAKFALKL